MTPTALPMPIKCVSPWAGGKRRMAPRIVELLGAHDTYVEPFVGGCSILPVKPVADREYVYDLNPDVIDVIWYLRLYAEHNSLFTGRLRGIVYGQAAFADARQRLAEPPAGYSRDERVADILTVWWMGPGGIAGTSRKPWFAQRHTKTGGCPRRRWESFIESVPSLCSRLANVCANVANGIESLERSGWVDRPGTAIYCDPPYLTKSFSYVVDFDTDAHQRLADILNGFARARVVVSYYDDGAGTLARLYPPSRWRRIDVPVSKNMSAASGTTGRAIEVLLVNDAKGVSPTQ